VFTKGQHPDDCFFFVFFFVVFLAVVDEFGGVLNGKDSEMLVTAALGRSE
jgi:hypothetical protein